MGGMEYIHTYTLRDLHVEYVQMGVAVELMIQR